MNKKKIIIIATSILTILLLITGIIWYQNYHEKQVKKKNYIKLVENTKKKYEFFTKNEIQKDSTETTIVFLNNVIQEQEKNNKINLPEFTQAIITPTILEDNNMDIILEQIKSEINKYQKESLEQLTTTNLIKDIDQSIDQETLVKLFENHNFIKNLEQEKKKRAEYLTNLTTIQQDILHIQEQKEQFYKNNNKYLCKTEEVLNMINEFNTKYNLGLTVEKEPNKVIHNPYGVPILCYHGVLDNPWGIEYLFVKVAEFEAQMRYLSEQGYTTLHVSEIANANQYQKPIIITFDDGYKDVYTNAFPILQKYNLKANVYMISGWINGDVYMTTEMTQEMSKSPLIEIGSHTVSHQQLAQLSDSEIDYELRESKKALEEMLGMAIDVIAYPVGSYDSRVLNLVKNYYKYALSTDVGTENPNALNTYTLNRIYVLRNYNLEQFKSLFY